MQESVQALYQWDFPQLPMDLSFLDENDKEWFVSVAHEKMSWFNISNVEKQDILDKIPSLELGEDNSKTIEQLLQDKQAKTLIIKSMDLHEVPPEISDFKQLQRLSICSDNITHIPEFIGNLPNLKTLRISGNKIKSIPPSIFNLHKLKELHIDNTSISVIHKEIGQLKNLSTLDLSNNKIVDLPEEICDLNNLWVLFVPFNLVCGILPSSIGGRWIALADRQQMW